MQDLTTLMADIAVPQQQLQQARDAVHQAKQEASAWNEKRLVELKAHRDELLAFLRLSNESKGTADQSVQSAWACMVQLEARHAVHQRVCSIFQTSYRRSSI